RWGIAADYYHGRRPKHERDAVQASFMDGRLQVIAATNAFGLGIDKPDVRFVIHRDIPPSVEEDYQEAGRAWRDGALPRRVLIYHVGDLGRAAFLAGGSQLEADDVVRLRAALLQDRRDQSITRDELQAATGLGEGNLVRLLELLEEGGIVSHEHGMYQLR